MIEHFDLTDRVAIVTGAGSPNGIGFVTAEILAGLGASVVIASTTERIFERVGELREAGFRAEGFVGDLTRPETSNELVSHAIEHFGHLDILVHNAGMTSVSNPQGPATSLESLGDEEWHAGIERNLDATYYIAKAVLPSMLNASWGRIVFVASVSGPVMAMRNEPVYAASKAGMVGLARAMAIDAAGNGITVNAVAPGWIATDSQTIEEHRQGLASPMGRSAHPSEVAATIAWLATPGASYITGQCIVVDGGNSIAEERA